MDMDVEAGMGLPFSLASPFLLAHLCKTFMFLDKVYEVGVCGGRVRVHGCYVFECTVLRVAKEWYCNAPLAARLSPHIFPIAFFVSPLGGAWHAQVPTSIVPESAQPYNPSDPRHVYYGRIPSHLFDSGMLSQSLEQPPNKNQFNFQKKVHFVLHQERNLKFRVEHGVSQPSIFSMAYDPGRPLSRLCLTHIGPPHSDDSLSDLEMVTRMHADDLDLKALRESMTNSLQLYVKTRHQAGMLEMVMMMMIRTVICCYCII